MEIIGCLVLDVIIVSLLILMIVYGIKKGFSGSSAGIITSLLSLGAGGVLAFLCYKYPFEKFGWNDGLTESFDKMLGGNNALFEKMGMTSEQVAGWLAMALLILIAFVFCYIIVRVLFFLIGKVVKKCRNLKGFMIIDSTLGVLINVGLFAAIVLGIFGFIHAFEGSDYLVNANEFLKATYLTKVIYTYNPLNSIFENMNLVSTFDKLF